MKIASGDINKLIHWSAALCLLARRAPNRLTLSQASAFLLAGLCDLRGEPITFTDLRIVLGSGAGRCLNSHYRVFLEATPKYPSRLGWLSHYPCGLDGRKKPFRLTRKGRAVIDQMFPAFARPIN